MGGRPAVGAVKDPAALVAVHTCDDAINVQFSVNAQSGLRLCYVRSGFLLAFFLTPTVFLVVQSLHFNARTMRHLRRHNSKT